MQLFILIIVNIILGTIFYLIISLKLEKKASQFQEKKLRKEMDEIITEFNSTADRNISILEKKIETVRKLMQISGNIKNIDMVIQDPENSSGKESIESILKKDIPYKKPEFAKSTETSDFNRITSGTEKLSLFSDIKKNLLKLFNQSDNLVSKRNNKMYRESTAHEKIIEPVKHPKNTGWIVDEEITLSTGTENFVPEEDTFAIKKDLSSMVVSEEKLDEKQNLDESEISKIVSDASDRYSAISQLYDHGCTIEVISKYSGIPEGEVKLVLNLSK